jgi:hypothetical protein
MLHWSYPLGLVGRKSRKLRLRARLHKRVRISITARPAGFLIDDAIGGRLLATVGELASP